MDFEEWINYLMFRNYATLYTLRAQWKRDVVASSRTTAIRTWAARLHGPASVCCLGRTIYWLPRNAARFPGRQYGFIALRHPIPSRPPSVYGALYSIHYCKRIIQAKYYHLLRGL